MEFKNKRILVVCKETFSYPLYYLAQRWVKENSVGAFFFNPVETKLAKGYLNDTTYYAFKEIEGVKIYNSDAITDEMTSLLHSDEYDESALEDIERNYSHYLNANLQIISTQFLTRHYHWRNYFSECTYPQQLNWLILNYKNVKEILDDFKPDVILDTDIAELARCVLREVAYKRNIPYISLSYSRVESCLLCSYNLDLHYSNLFSHAYQEKLTLGESKLSEELSYIEDYRRKQHIMPKMYQNFVTSQYKPISIKKMIRGQLSIIHYFWQQEWAGNNHKLKKNNPLLFNNSYQYIKYYWNYELGKQKLFRKNKYFQPPVEGEKYVYMPLHLIPESSTFSMAPLYINEISTIEAISKSLPAGWWLYVKEHQVMIGERGTDFYERVNKLPNVKMVQLNYYDDPKPWIINSMGVVTITGTTAYEAAMLGKHAIVFSDVPFALIDGVERIKSYEDLPEAIKSFTKPLNNKKSCAAYLAAVKEQGRDIDLHFFHKYGVDIVRNGMELPEEGKNVIDNLEKLFFEGYQMYEKECELQI